ncbi:uncharacterized protein CTHT_0018990 [Thermochaetoides thermophila DSM 1495]|uniref:Uncharacterized protein n=1 Tax=Chaetomium thermophilum (strain DSM 1495 / CBS 144.50 / IMI 039719) TaxID=759272 RepID=G0S2Z0_CHATD|nr:hypothetical protein CTHT_0018990 [Thermochaetoides thermophila DSM 1495]EGS22373.1 hypothetical protein CTHT_0018990 [Thermochaetoides thermophila DSM 1495]
MKFEPLVSRNTVPRTYVHAKLSDTYFYSILRDNFPISTWLALGAITQSFLLFLFPAHLALAPALTLLLFRATCAVLATVRLLPNHQMDGVVPGKWTAQLPNKEGEVPGEVAERGLVVISLGARSNHPFGILGPGFKEVGDLMDAMLKELHERAEEFKFLGHTSFVSTERHTTNQVMSLCYFRTIEGLHAYAHSALHRKAWEWWNKITNTHPHLSIMHEAYYSPKKEWENIYVNSHPTGFADTNAFISVDGRPSLPIFDARMGRLRSHRGRLGRGDGTDNEEYGSEPY